MSTDVIVKSRVRIARNIKDYPFPPVLNDICRKEIVEKVSSALADHGYHADENIKDAIYAHTLSEENIISREFATEKDRHELLKNDEKQVYIMIGEEDHLRIQSFANGLDLQKAGENAIECERLIN